MIVYGNDRFKWDHLMVLMNTYASYTYASYGTCIT